MKHPSAPGDPAGLKREHLQQLLSSQTFQRSPKLSQLLRRLVEQTLTEAPYPLKEQLLGIEVFDRPTDWDPQTDSIVRVNVNRLRLVLTSYYADENPTTAVRFVIPKGSYTAQCVLLSPQSPPVSRQSERSNDRTARNKQNLLCAPASSMQSKDGPRLPGIRLQRLTSERGDVTNAAFCPMGSQSSTAPVGAVSPRVSFRNESARNIAVPSDSRLANCAMCPILASFCLHWEKALLGP
jgi:hypothetical protein